MSAKMRFLLLTTGIVCSFVLTAARIRVKFYLDERSVCNVKKTCFDCLQLSFCSWCEAENKCFSRELPIFEDYCKDNRTIFVNHGFSIKDNAYCACIGNEVGKTCFPPGVTEGQECSGRGNCVCGRCVCYPQPVSEHPTKMVMGEFCEFDNYSCDDPKCNEGPYHINGHFSNDDDDNDEAK